MSPGTLLLTAARVLPEPARLLEGGGLLVAAGRVVEVLEDVAAVRRRASERAVRCQDLGDVVLTPGLVVAHAHLELGWAQGRLDGGAGFASWVGGLVRARSALEPLREVDALEAGLARLIACGATTVGDIDASDAYDRLPPDRAATPPARPRVVRLREVLDAGDPVRTEAALARVRVPPPERALVREGLSPHAPFTVGAPLLRACAALARERSLPLQVHWAESEDERAWLLRGEGPFAAVLGPSPRRGGLALLAEAGLLGRTTSLVHANLPEPGDVEGVAAAGCGVVHCPGTHAYFGRAPFQWERWRAAGVPLALGTDSLASNDELDPRRELALAAAAPGSPGPEELFAAATVGGARVLGLEQELGRLLPGLRADVAAFELPSLPPAAGPAARLDATLEGLVVGLPPVVDVRLGGQPTPLAG